MNDPHVEALRYRIENHADVDYDRAEPLEHTESSFTVRLAGNEATVSPTVHWATAEEARATVEPYLRAWELSASLEVQPGELAFRYLGATIVDRSPRNATIVPLTGVALVMTAGTLRTHVSRGRFPAPPSSLQVDYRVEVMDAAFRAYYAGSRALPDAAYFCLTALESVGSRRDASSTFGIDETVLKKVGELTSTRGGQLARKFVGRRIDLSGSEKAWLTEVIKVMIRQAAHVAAGSDPGVVRMSDLPPLA